MKIIWSLIEKRMTVNNPWKRKFYSSIIITLLNKKGSYIPSGAKFEGQPTFPHGIYGIFISDGAVIGKDVVIFHQVTIGSNTLGDSDKIGAPTIGNNCYIGAGAKIIGNVRVGNNVRIGANCVVVKDVPDNCVVVNQPARVIVRDEGMDNRFRGMRKVKKD